jgi:hypothetical protein
MRSAADGLRSAPVPLPGPLCTFHGGKLLAKQSAYFPASSVFGPTEQGYCSGKRKIMTETEARKIDKT